MLLTTISIWPLASVTFLFWPTSQPIKMPPKAHWGLRNNSWNSELRLKFQMSKMNWDTRLQMVKSREAFTTTELMLISASAPWAILQSRQMSQRPKHTQIYINRILGCWFHKTSLHYYQESELNSSRVLKLNLLYNYSQHMHFPFKTRRDIFCKQDVNTNIAV